MNKQELILKVLEMLLNGDDSQNGSIAIEHKQESKFAGQKVIIRSRDAGVHFGTLVYEGDNHVILENSRRMDRFYVGGNEDSLSAIVRHGIIQHDNSRISGVISHHIKIVGHCEVLPIGESQAKTIEEAPIYVR